MAGCCCASESEVNLLYSCSGAANTGELADRVMRRLSKNKVGSSTCLAALGADLSGFVESGRNATRNIVLDGCKVRCGAKGLERHKLTYQGYVMTDFGVEKGKTPITEELIERVANEIAAKVRI